MNSIAQLIGAAIGYVAVYAVVFPLQAVRAIVAGVFAVLSQSFRSLAVIGANRFRVLRYGDRTLSNSDLVGRALPSELAE